MLASGQNELKSCGVDGVVCEPLRTCVTAFSDPKGTKNDHIISVGGFVGLSSVTYDKQGKLQLRPVMVVPSEIGDNELRIDVTQEERDRLIRSEELANSGYRIVCKRYIDKDTPKGMSPLLAAVDYLEDRRAILRQKAEGFDRSGFETKGIKLTIPEIIEIIRTMPELRESDIICAGDGQCPAPETSGSCDIKREFTYLFTTDKDRVEAILGMLDEKAYVDGKPYIMDGKTVFIKDLLGPELEKKIRAHLLEIKIKIDEQIVAVKAQLERIKKLEDAQAWRDIIIILLFAYQPGRDLVPWAIRLLRERVGFDGLVDVTKELQEKLAQDPNYEVKGYMDQARELWRKTDTRINFRNIMITGPMGSGKTDLIRAMVLLFLNREKEDCIPEDIRRAKVAKTIKVGPMRFRLGQGEVTLGGLSPIEVQSGTNLRGNTADKLKPLFRMARQRIVIVTMDEISQILLFGASSNGDQERISKLMLAEYDDPVIRRNLIIFGSDNDGPALAEGLGALKRRFPTWITKYEDPLDVIIEGMKGPRQGEFERDHKVKIEDSAIDAAARLGEMIWRPTQQLSEGGTFVPRNTAIRYLLEEACRLAKKSETKVVTKDTVIEALDKLLKETNNDAADREKVAEILTAPIRSLIPREEEARGVKSVVYTPLRDLEAEKAKLGPGEPPAGGEGAPPIPSPTGTATISGPGGVETIVNYSMGLPAIDAFMPREEGTNVQVQATMSHDILHLADIYGIDHKKVPAILAASEGVTSETGLSKLAGKNFTAKRMVAWITSPQGQAFITKNEKAIQTSFANNMKLAGPGILFGIAGMMGADHIADVIGLDPVYHPHERFAFIVYMMHGASVVGRSAGEIFFNRLEGRPYDFVRQVVTGTGETAVVQMTFEARTKFSRALLASLAGSIFDGALVSGMSKPKIIWTGAKGILKLPISATLNMGPGLASSLIMDKVVGQWLPVDSKLRAVITGASFFIPDLIKAIPSMNPVTASARSMGLGIAARAFAALFALDLGTMITKRIVLGDAAAYEAGIEARVSERYIKEEERNRMEEIYTREGYASYVAANIYFGLLGFANEISGMARADTTSRASVLHRVAVKHEDETVSRMLQEDMPRQIQELLLSGVGGEWQREWFYKDASTAAFLPSLYLSSDAKEIIDVMKSLQEDNVFITATPDEQEKIIRSKLSSLTDDEVRTAMPEVNKYRLQETLRALTLIHLPINDRVREFAASDGSLHAGKEDALIRYAFGGGDPQRIKEEIVKTRRVMLLARLMDTVDKVDSKDHVKLVRLAKRIGLINEDGSYKKDDPSYNVALLIWARGRKSIGETTEITRKLTIDALTLWESSPAKAEDAGDMLAALGLVESANQSIQHPL